MSADLCPICYGRNCRRASCSEEAGIRASYQQPTTVRVHSAPPLPAKPIQRRPNLRARPAARTVTDMVQLALLLEGDDEIEAVLRVAGRQPNGEQHHELY